jgi:hypothetical protein
MAQPVSTPQRIPDVSPRRFAPGIAVVGAVLGAVLVLVALGLWFRYGTAVFFEMIASGIAGCF